MPWTINSEIFPLQARSSAMGITTAVNWLSNLVVSFSFLSIQVVTTPAGVFWIFAVIAACGWVYFYFNLPETKDRSIEQVQTLFQAHKVCSCAHPITDEPEHPQPGYPPISVSS